MKTIQKWSAVLMLLMLLTMSFQKIEAQVMGGVDLTGVPGKVDIVKDQVANIINPVLGIVMLILMIGCIYLIGSGHQRAKEATIGWFIALVFWGLGYMLLG